MNNLSQKVLKKIREVYKVGITYFITNESESVIANILADVINNTRNIPKHIDSTRSHVTLRITSLTPELVLESIEDYKDEFNLKSITLKNPRYTLLGEKGDVLAITFDSDVLHQLNTRLDECQVYNISQFREYNPHLTLIHEFGGSTEDLDKLPKLPEEIILYVKLSIEKF